MRSIDWLLQTSHSRMSASGPLKVLLADQWPSAPAVKASLESNLTTLPKIQNLAKNSAENSAFSESPVHIQSFGLS